MTARVACVMKMRPLNPVFSVKYGTPAAWSMWKCDTRSRSTVDKSTVSRKGNASRPLRPGWMPQSSRTLLPRNSSKWQLRPTSLPPPSGVICNVSSMGCGACVAPATTCTGGGSAMIAAARGLGALIYRGVAAQRRHEFGIIKVALRRPRLAAQGQQRVLFSLLLPLLSTLVSMYASPAHRRAAIELI